MITDSSMLAGHRLGARTILLHAAFKAAADAVALSVQTGTTMSSTDRKDSDGITTRC